jgi:uncharacterized protein involved in outer membrane biogenesis
MRWLKYTVIGLASLLVVSVMAVAILALCLDQDQIRDALVHVVNRTTDHHLEINGSLEVDLSLSPSIRVSELYFKTGSENFEASVTDLRIQIDMMSLRSHFVIVPELFIKDSVVTIRQSPDDVDEATLFKPLQTKTPVVEELFVQNLAFNYFRPDETEPLHINLESLRKDDKAHEGLIPLTGAGTIDGTAFRLDGRFGTVATLLTSDQPYPLDAHLHVMQTAIHASGSIANPQQTGDLDIALQLEAPDVQDVLELLHVSTPDIGQLMATSRLAGTLEAPRLDDLQLKVSKDRVALQVAGTVGNIFTAEDISLDFSAQVSDPELLAWLLPEQAPRFDSLRSSGILTGSIGTLLLDDFTLVAAGPGGDRLEVAGRTRILDAPQPLHDLNATLAVASPDTTLLRQFTAAVPLIGPLSGTARLSMDAGVLMIKDLKLTAGDKKTVQIEGQGDIGHIVFSPAVAVSNIDMRLILTGSSAGKIGELINIGMPDVGPVRVSGRYSGSIASSTIKDLQLQAGRPQQLQIQAGGNIRLADLGGDKPLDGLELDVSLEAPSTSSLRAITGIEMPELGGIRGVARVTSASGVAGIQSMHIEVQKGNDIQLTLNGMLADLVKMEGLDMKVDLSAKDLNTIGQLFDQPLPKEGQVALSGHLKGSLEKNRFNGRTRLRNTTILTYLSGDFTGSRPRLAGSINIPELDVHDVGYYPEFTAATTSSTASVDDGDYRLTEDGYNLYKESKSARTTPLFSKEPIDLSGLNTINLDLDVKVDKISSTIGKLDNISSHLVLDNGRLDIIPLIFSVDGDVITLNSTIDSSIQPPSVTLQLTGDEVDLGLLFRDSATEAALIRGIINTEADLHSRGHSVAELAAGLDGHIYMVTENASVKKSHMNLLNVDVLGFLITNIMTIISPKKDVNVSCAIFSMHFDNGIGKTDLIILDTPDTLVRIDASLNLVNETMDIAILPEYKVRLFRKRKPTKIYGPITNPTYEMVSLVDLTREATRSWLLAPLTISKELLGPITRLVVDPGEVKGSCNKFLE